MLKSQIFKHLSSSAIILLLLIATVLVFQHYLHGQLYRAIAEGEVSTQKMHLISSLMEIARSRTRMTGEMLVVEDPFERDAIAMEMDRLATRFVQLRTELLDLPLTDQERDLLHRQAQIIPQILQAQRIAADIALTDESPEGRARATRILYTDVFPGQGQVIDFFMDMLNGVKDETMRRSDAALQSHDLWNQVQFLVLTLFGIAVVYVMARAIWIVSLIERDLHIDKEQAQITLRSIGDAVLITDAKGVISNVNDAFAKIFDQDGEAIIGQPIEALFNVTDPDTGQSLADCVASTLSEHRQFDLNLSLNCTFNQKDYHLAISVSPVLGTDGDTFGSVITIKDITEQRRIAEHMEYQASYDQLTGLLNRHSFEQRARARLAALQPNQQHCIGLIDLDRFKAINDTCGHSAGDEALRQIANLIKSRIRRDDYAARIGGDEFTLFLNQCDRAAAETVMEELRQLIADFRFAWEDKIFTLGCSIGAVLLREGDSDFGAAFRCADTACYMSKDAGRNRVTFLDLDSHNVQTVKEEVDWVRRIQNALDQDGLILHAQPIFPAEQLDPPCIMHEILVRMREQGQTILPYQFIPAAERYDLIGAIDLWVVNRVLLLIGSHRIKGIACVNLSGKTLGDRKHTRAIVDLVRNADIGQGRLCFEVTETAMISNLDNARSFLQEIRDLGCLSSLDDFGSGLSSFNYLDTLPLDYIKIDGALIQRVLEKKETRVMVASIHNIAHTIGLKSIAEYVDSEHLYETLKHMGIDCFQGFYLGRPRPLAEHGRYAMTLNAMQTS